MIRISDAAQAHFAKLLANQEEGTQIRVFVINPGTPNAECGVSYCPPDAVEDTDTALKFEQLTAYVKIGLIKSRFHKMFHYHNILVHSQNPISKQNQDASNGI